MKKCKNNQSSFLHPAKKKKKTVLIQKSYGEYKKRERSVIVEGTAGVLGLVIYGLLKLFLSL